MLKSVYVEGYKGLHALHLEDLRLVNIIVGQSSAGKTALLESIKIALSGNPSTMWTTSASRGAFSYLQPNATGEQFEASWRQFFSNFDADSLIRMFLKRSDGATSHVSAFFDRDSSMTWSPQGGPTGTIQAYSYNPLVFERSSFDGSFSKLMVSLAPGQGLHMEQGPELGIPSEYLASSSSANIIQLADWFSALSIEDLEHDVVTTICSTFPNVTGLSVQSPNGFAQLYATLGNINRKLPVTSISSGLTKFITILLAMNVKQNGVVLVDEIENAIYYKMFPLLWDTILSFAVRTGTQVFASTHSWECLSAAASSFRNKEDELSLIQVRNVSGSTEALTIAGANVVDAVTGDIEVRR